MKKKLLEILESVKNDVNGHFPSLYSKDDVMILLVNIVDRVEVLEDSTSEIDWDELQNKIINDLESTLDNFNYDDSVGLDLDHNNHIDIEFNSRDIINEIKDSIRTTVDDFVTEEVNND